MSARDEGERRDFGTIYKRGRLYWIRYRVGGVDRRESTKSGNYHAAVRLLEKRRDELGRGEHLEPRARRSTFEDLVALLREDYAQKGNRSWDRVLRALIPLTERFAGVRLNALTAQRVLEYQAERRAEGIARATINYESAVLRRMCRLALEAGLLTRTPVIRTPKVENAREGYFEAEDFALVRDELPEYLAGPATFAYLTGWRMRREVVTLTWECVDWHEGTVTLPVSHSKGKHPRRFPFRVLPELAALLERQRALTTALEREQGRVIPLVFHRHGAEMKDYYTAWRSALKRAQVKATKGALTLYAAGDLEKRIPHDMRRTAVRALVRAGVPEGVAMTITGHKTRAVFERYNITSGRDQDEAVAKLAEYLGQVPTGTSRAQSPIRVVHNS